MSEAEAIQQIDPPKTIAAEPFTLDDVLFTPEASWRRERAVCSGEYVGDLLMDIVEHDDPTKRQVRWFARKFDARGEMTDWKLMRCCAEARAFLVSKIRQ